MAMIALPHVKLYMEVMPRRCQPRLLHRWQAKAGSCPLHRTAGWSQSNSTEPHMPQGLHKGFLSWMDPVLFLQSPSALTPNHRGLPRGHTSCSRSPSTPPPCFQNTCSFVAAQASGWEVGLPPCTGPFPSIQGTDSSASLPGGNGAEDCLERAQAQEEVRARETQGALFARERHEALTCQGANVPVSSWITGA